MATLYWAQAWKGDDLVGSAELIIQSGYKCPEDPTELMDDAITWLQMEPLWLVPSDWDSVTIDGPFEIRSGPKK